jgi:hypothetical protein
MYMKSNDYASVKSVLSKVRSARVLRWQKFHNHLPRAKSYHDQSDRSPSSLTPDVRLVDFLGRYEAIAQVLPLHRYLLLSCVKVLFSQPGSFGEIPWRCIAYPSSPASV